MFCYSIGADERRWNTNHRVCERVVPQCGCEMHIINLLNGGMCQLRAAVRRDFNLINVNNASAWLIVDPVTARNMCVFFNARQI